MKTKPFLLATAGSTVDGRVIDEQLLEQMASSYDPKTYGARLNIEHIRGISGQAPFRAYGDVLEVSIGETEVNFNGKTEKRKALFGVLDVTDEAKALNDAGQKVYSSIEIEPNFGGKGHAYLMGVALTDSPASIATERLQFNRTQPGLITLSRGDAGQPSDPALIEFADAAAADQAGAGFIAGFGAMLEKTFAKFTPATEPKPEPKPKEGEAQAFTVADLKQMFTELAQVFASSIDGLRSEFQAESDQVALKLKALETTIEGTPEGQHTARPAAAGANGKFAKTDC